jgi:heavy metal sensor kinase
MFAAAAALLSVSSWWMLRRSLIATEYHELQERAEDVQLLLAQAQPGTTAESLAKEFNEIYRLKDDGKYLQILDQDGHWLYRSKRMVEEGLLPASPNSLPAEGTTIEFFQGTRYVRVLTYPIRAHGRAYSVQTGITLNRSRMLLSTFRTQLLWLTPAMLLLAAIGGHFMSRKALAPVAAIANEARLISDRNLDVRLPIAATRDEISHLSETLNQMLERVELGFRSMRDFTANAAHELRTPLALIRAEVEIALSRPRATEDYREACVQVQAEAIRMTGLIDSMLMLARADAGTEVLSFEIFDASQFTLRVAEPWRAAMRQAMLDFDISVPSAAAFVTADKDCLQRLLTILLDNANRYTPPGGSVRLEVSKEKNRVAFAVRDTGVGISPEDQSRVFDRFYRAHRDIQGVSRGSGLGLALAKWIAERHGTVIHLESAAGQGTTMLFSIREAPAPVVTQENSFPIHHSR